MNIRNFGGGLGGLIVVGIVIFLKFGLGSAMSQAKIDEYSEQTKQEFLSAIADAPVNEGSNKNYVDWLVDCCHEQAWKDNHEIEYVSRRRSECVVDSDGYGRSMLTAMINLARQEGAPAIADGVGEIYNKWYQVE